MKVDLFLPMNEKNYYCIIISTLKVKQKIKYKYYIKFLNKLNQMTWRNASLITNTC